MHKLALIGGIALCLGAVVIGAFGAHALSDVLDQTGRHDVYELANRYQFYHGLALLMLAALASQLRIMTRLVAALMLCGTLVFSGSLYLLALTNVGYFGAITPVGGTLLILAWLRFLFDVYHQLR